MLLRQSHRTTLHRIRSSQPPSSLWTRWTPTVYYTLAAQQKPSGLKHDGQRGVAPGAGITRGARTMATAIADASLYDAALSGLHPSSISRAEAPIIKPNYHLRPFDVANALRFDLDDTPPPPRLSRTTQDGLSGDSEELVAVFNACLQVRKVERAQLVLRRLGQLESLPPNQLIALHNRFLRASLDQLRDSPKLNGLEQLHKWYELQIRQRRLPQTAETVACMLKASISSQRGARLERSVTRYMSMASGESGLEVLSMADILTDQDLATITNICSTYNLVGDEEPIPPDGEAQLPVAAETHTSTPDAAHVRPTPQKGMSLKLVRDTLSLFDELPNNLDVSSLHAHERQEIQTRLERDCVDAAMRRWREESEQLQKMGLNTIFGHQSLGSRFHEWHQNLEASLKEELQKVEQAENKKEKKVAQDLDRCTYGPFLRQSTPSRLAAVTILGTINCASILGAEKGVKLSAVVSTIAKLVEEDIKEQSTPPNRGFTGRHGARRRVVQNVLKGQHDEAAAAQEPTPGGTISTEAPPIEVSPDKPWPVTIQAKVGAVLLSALLQTAKIRVFKKDPDTKETISQEQRAFHHTKKLRRGKKFGALFLNDTLTQLLKKEPDGNFLAKHLPMVVEPKPWTKFHDGAFFSNVTDLVRLKAGQRDHKIYTEAAIARGDLDQVLRGLDILGKTAWRVNKAVMSVMIEAWNSGSDIADIPAFSPDISYPKEPTDREDRKARGVYFRAVTAAENKKSGLHSVRCFNNLQLEVARAFRNQTFYLPHNIDFRGRAYPLPTYLNHMGADNVRGLLRFAKGKELGERGFWWLKVHVANVFGHGKVSLDDRVAFTEEHLDKVLDSAANPLNGQRWWLEGDDPWQTLAACFELKAALDSPDATKFVSTLPIHQDGSCNGLQHYAALGGDVWGAQQVNLQPGDGPADVYAAVAKVVIELVDRDAEAGIPFAKAVQGKITRKVVKQTVMTNVYGVTFAGARKQVCKQLDDLYPKLEAETGIAPLVLASYIARHVFKALSSMFHGAHEIQTWLGESGGRICTALLPDQIRKIAQSSPTSRPTPRRRSSRTAVGAASPSKKFLDELTSQFRSTIVWTTPLRMPVAQPYRRSAVKVVKTCIQDLSMKIPTASDAVHRQKQLQGFPPNFIHSLDASHMMLSALQCEDHGLTFAAVHDSFWTHAADVDTMNDVLRDCFIRIHSEDVIGRLAAEFEARYKGAIYLAKVKLTSAVGRKIVAWRKSQTLTIRDELLLEDERQRLLRSEDWEEVARGMEMVTAASIFDAGEGDTTGEDSLAAPDGFEDMPGLSKMSPAEGAATDASLTTTAPIADESSLVDEDEEEEGGENDDLGEMVGTTAEAADGWVEKTLEDLDKTGMEVKMEAALAKKKAKRAPATTPVWLPLRLPPVPRKGDFDVRSVRTSQYFFS